MFFDWTSTVKLMNEIRGVIFVYGFVEDINADRGTMTVSYTKLGKQRKSGISINFGSFGSHGGMRIMPKIGDRLILGFNNDGDIFHLGSIGYHYEDLVEKDLDVGSEVGKMKHIRPGEFHIQAVKASTGDSHPIPQGSIYGDNAGNIEIKDGNLSKIRLDTTERELINEVETIRSTNHKIRFVQGVVKREQTQTDGSKEMTPRTYLGIPVENTLVPQLSEYRLKVGQDTNPATGEDLGEPTTELVFSEQVLDDDAAPEYDSSISFLNTLIKYKNGLTISINENGVMNIAEGAMIIIPKKRAARESDTTETPISMIYIDTDHPSQTANATSNVVEMQKLAPQFFSPVGPCVFVPSQQVLLKSAIVEGSDSLYVGD